ncbi:MAG: ARMT1-like domain-containing protein [Candidatus Bathyarchaeia archaeon]
MKTHPLCIPCTLRAAYNIARKATDSEEVQRRAVLETLKWLNEEEENLMNITPAALHTYAFKIIQRISGNNDPFKYLKKMSNSLAIKMMTILRREVSDREKIETVKLAALGAVCGNSIDFEVEGYYASIEDLEKMLLSSLKSGLVIDETEKLIDALSKSRRILYLLDNAGEIAFDKLFIEVIAENYPIKVIAAVKSRPILNDATMEDALEVGLHEVAEVIVTGNDYIGLNLEESSEDFRREIKEANIIIAKGQGYYESITEVERILNRPIAYMLKAKCPVIAKSLSVPQGSNIIKFVGKI